MIGKQRARSSLGIGCLAAFFVVGCVVADGERDGVEHTATAATSAEGACWQTTLAWGDGAGQVGLVPAAPGRAARGPQALAIDGDGEVFVLDNVNGRVLAIEPTGEARVAVAKVAAHSEDLALAPDGAIATYSPLLATVSIADASGAPAGEVAVSRSLRHVRGISMQSSRRVVVHSAYQETFPVGSAAAPLSLPETLHGKREGAALLPGERGVIARASGDGAVELQVVRALSMDSVTTGDRQRTLATLPVPGAASAGRVVGAADGLACVTLEQLTDGATVRVQRRVACLRLASPAGAVVFDEPLPAPAVYQPARPVALGGAPLAVAWMQPSDVGLVVRSCRLSGQLSAEVSR